MFDRYNIVSNDDLRLAMERQSNYLSRNEEAMATEMATIEQFPVRQENVCNS